MDYALRNLSNKLNKPFKYCMTTIIQQNNGAGLLTCGTLIFFLIWYIIIACGYQDLESDGSISILKEINDITIICTVFAFLI